MLFLIGCETEEGDIVSGTYDPSTNDDPIHIANNAKNRKKTNFRNPAIHRASSESLGSLSNMMETFYYKGDDGKPYTSHPVQAASTPAPSTTAPAPRHPPDGL